MRHSQHVCLRVVTIDHPFHCFNAILWLPMCWEAFVFCDACRRLFLAIICALSGMGVAGMKIEFSMDKIKLEKGECIMESTES